MNTDTIQDYILENKDNLRIAVAVSNAWAEAEEELVLGFFDRLRSRLEETLKGRDFNQPRCYLKCSEAAFSFWKQAWKEEYYVNLYFGHQGKEVCFGLGRDASKKHIKKRPPCTELCTAIKQRYPSARPHSWWEGGWITLQSPAADWNKPEVLWRMHDEKDPFLDEVAEQLLEVARISEPIVDRFVNRLVRKK